MARLDPLLSALRLLREATDRTACFNIVGTMVVVTASGALAAGAPLALKDLVDALTGVRPGSDEWLLPGGIYLLALFGGRLASDVRPLLAGKVEQQVLAGLRQRFFAHVLRLPIAYLITRRSGELLHGVDLAAAGIQLIISHIANSIAPVLVELAMMAVVLAHLQQPALVVLFAATALLYLAIFATGAIRLQDRASAVTSASLEVHAQLNDGIANNETLRCFGARGAAETALHQASSELAAQWLRFNRLTVQISLAASVVFALALWACFAISADAVSRGEMSVGAFVLASVYMLQMVHPLEVMGSAARDLSRALRFMRPLLEVLATPAEALENLPPPASPREVRAPQAPALQLENLHFAYEPNRPVFQGLNLDIPAGRMTAIVGRSGCGKSSLVRLLLRLHSPQSGRILVHGHPISDLPVADLRTLIGLVPQEVGLLHKTAADNIALGVPNATRADIELAARSAQLHHVIDALPDGYETVLGERSQTLSGGERQRLAIARALLRRPQIFLLDEPTSMLDSETEAEIMRALQKRTAGCTTLVIAHRLSTVMHADEIVVLEGGRVHEQGRHAELLGRNGLYAQLWKQQATGPLEPLSQTGST